MHILNNYFDNIFLISHPDSLRHKNFMERWEGLNFSQAKFVHQDKSMELFGDLVSHNFSFTNPLKHKNLIKGQVACAIAHMLIYQEIIDKDIYDALILEDDSVFKSLSFLDVALNSDYDILSLFTAKCDLYYPESKNSPFTDQYSKAGTSAYVIKNPEVAQRLLSAQLADMVPSETAIMESKLKVYAVWPEVCTITNEASMIAGGIVENLV